MSMTAQNTSVSDLLALARTIGADVWEDRVRKWRSSQKQECPQPWIDSVRRAYGWGNYDKEDAVQGALRALNARLNAGEGA